MHYVLYIHLYYILPYEKVLLQFELPIMVESTSGAAVFRKVSAPRRRFGMFVPSGPDVTLKTDSSEASHRAGGTHGALIEKHHHGIQSQ